MKIYVDEWYYKKEWYDERLLRLEELMPARVYGVGKRKSRRGVRKDMNTFLLVLRLRPILEARGLCRYTQKWYEEIEKCIDARCNYIYLFKVKKTGEMSIQKFNSYFASFVNIAVKQKVAAYEEFYLDEDEEYSVYASPISFEEGE